MLILSVITAFFDMFVLEYSFFISLKNLFFSEIAVGRNIVWTGAVVGLLSSIITDIRLYLNKKRLEEN
jgi:hypothetical protein